MNLSIIGSGNIAHFFAIKCMEAGHSIHEIISRNKVTGEELAQKCMCSYQTDYTLSTNTTFLLAIPDDAIRSLANSSFFQGKRVIHTSGSIGINELKNISEYVACLWPIYSIQKENLPSRKDIPFILQSSNENSRRKTVSLAKCLTNNLTEATDEQKSLLHLNAVLVNNFTNHLFALSEQLLQEHNLSFTELMHPIIENTIAKLKHNSPQNLQTGPAIRNDKSTLHKHLELLTNQPKLAEIYKLLSTSILAQTDDLYKNIH